MTQINETTAWEGWLGNSGDHESDLLDFNARLYDPYIGRFLAVDELWAEQPGWNPYHYSQNDPINRMDPSGYIDFNFDAEGNYIGISNIYTDDYGFTVETDNGIDRFDMQANSINNITMPKLPSNWKGFIVELNNQDDAKNLFEFMSDNITGNNKGEWGVVYIDSPDHPNSAFVSTNFNKTGLGMNGLIRDDFGGRNLEYVKRMDHSHPYGPIPSVNDVNTAVRDMNSNSRILFNIYNKGSYHEYP